MLPTEMAKAMFVKKTRWLLFLGFAAISQVGISPAVAGTFNGSRTGPNMFAQLKVNETAGTERGFPGLNRRATTAEWRAKWR
jgi:hypothetical protein